MAQEHPQYRRDGVPTFDDLPLNDEIGTTRRVAADGKIYQTINDSIERTQRWAVLGATQTVLGN